MKPGDEITISEPIGLTNDGREIVWVSLGKQTHLGYDAKDGNIYLPSLDKTIVLEEKP